MFPSNLCSLNRGFSDVFNLKEQNVNIFQTSVDQIPHLKNKTSTIPSSGIHFSGSFVYLFVSSPQSCNIACQSAQSHKMSRYLYVNDIILSFFSVFFIMHDLQYVQTLQESGSVFPLDKRSLGLVTFLRHISPFPLLQQLRTRTLPTRSHLVRFTVKLDFPLHLSEKVKSAWMQKSIHLWACRWNRWLICRLIFVHYESLVLTTGFQSDGVLQRLEAILGFWFWVACQR